MDRLLFDAVDLWTTTPPYRHYPCETIHNRLMPAFYFGKLFGLYNDEGVLRGFASWAFMTRTEFLSRDYWGWEIFARDGGEMLVVVDMIAPGGKNDVLCLCRNLRALFKDRYPHVKTAYAHRGPRNGVFLRRGDERC